MQKYKYMFFLIRVQMALGFTTEKLVVKVAYFFDLFCETFCVFAYQLYIQCWIGTKIK